jgi:carbon monoxide dehydrogenase subunit G
MFFTIGLVVAGAVGALLAYAATRPGTMRVERSATVRATPAQIFPLINDFRRWNSWSPWEKLDPALNRTYSGAAQGRGAVYEWVGNRQVGQGRMEITEAAEPGRITIDLDFIKPFKAHNVTRFELLPEGDSTRVTWTMTGATPYMGKVMGVFVNMDQMIGKDFEKGLHALKAVAENRSHEQAAAPASHTTR